MKYVIRGALYNFLCIFVFGAIYTFLRKEFTLDQNMSKYIAPDIIDFIFLSTTIQAGVGVSMIYPMSNTVKLVMMTQQYFMILSNLMLLYFVTL